jgi:hypothetical protein
MASSPSRCLALSAQRKEIPLVRAFVKPLLFKFLLRTPGARTPHMPKQHSGLRRMEIELSPDATARINQLKAQREKVEAQMTRVQDLRALSELNGHLAEIGED